MKNLIIAGSGGLAAEVISYIHDINNKNKIINIKGIIDDNIENYNHNKSNYNFDYTYLGTLNNFEYSHEDYILICFTNIKMRELFINRIEKMNIKLFTLIHPTSIIDKCAKINDGNIIAPFCTIGPNVLIGKFNILTSYSFISHDCIVGRNNFLSTSGLSGNVKIENNNYFGIRSTILPSIKIGSNNIIQAGMVVDKNINHDETIFYRYKEKVTIIQPKYI